MSVYLVTYDLTKPERDYEGLYEELKKFPKWWHYLESSWLIYTGSDNAQAICDRLKPHIDDDDNLLIIEVGKDRQGWLPKKAWNWIRENLG